MRSAPVIALAVAAIAAMVSACKEEGPPPGPVEITAEATGYFCMMNISEHAGPKAQIHLAGYKKPLFFPSVIDAVAFLMLPGEDKSIRAIYVNDMGKATNWQSPEPGTWIDAKSAYFVIESKKVGGMRHKEAVPFGSKANAETFVSEYGGKISRLSEIPTSYVLPGTEAQASTAPPSPAGQQQLKETTR